jgi:hypothetical protein
MPCRDFDPCFTFPGPQEWREKRRDLLQRIEFAGGDFFDAATLPTADPTSRDVFMLRCVLHDWNDDKTRAILRSLRTAMGEPVAAEDKCHDKRPSENLLLPSPDARQPRGRLASCTGARGEL